MIDHIARGRAVATNTAAILLMRGEPLPLTLVARLNALGVNIAVLEARYAPAN